MTESLWIFPVDLSTIHPTTRRVFYHALIVQRFAHHVLIPHTTGGSCEVSSSPEVCGCGELASQVQRARLSCAGAESRMRNPHITVSGAIRVQRAATEPRCGELGDRQVQRAESRRRRTRLVVLKGGHCDAWPSRRGKRQVEKKAERGKHTHSRGVSRGGVKW